MLMPAPGATLSSSVLTERGYDCYTYSWAENPRMDGSKPLGIMEHLGGTPLVAVLGRTKVLPQDYLMSVKWLTTAHGYFEELALPTLTPEQKQQYHEWMEFAKPLLARLNSANITMLQPALADGQHAFVLDAKITSRRWFNGMPQGWAAADARAGAALRRQRCGLVEKGRGRISGRRRRGCGENPPEESRKQFRPASRFPNRKCAKSGRGAIYSYPLPRELGVDGQLAPGAGLGPNVAVLDDFAAAYGRAIELDPVRGRRAGRRCKTTAGRGRLRRLGRAGRGQHAVDRIRSADRLCQIARG